MSNHKKFGKHQPPHGNPEFPFAYFKNILGGEEMLYILWHWHRDLEISYVLEGEVTYKIGDHTFSLSQGNAVLINSGVIHNVLPLNSRYAYLYSFVFAPELLCSSLNTHIGQQYIKPLITNTRYPYFKIDNDIFNQISPMLPLIYDINENKRPGYEWITQNKIQSIYCLLFENVPELFENITDSFSNEDLLLKKLLCYIDSNYSEEIDLKQISNSANISISTCNRLFQSQLKISPVQYLTNVRIEHSRILLKETNRTLIDISLSCGFNSPSYFCRVFKKRYHVSPIQYRNSH